MELIIMLLNKYATNKDIDVFVKDGLFSLSDKEGAVSLKIKTKSFEFIDDHEDSFLLVTLQDEKKLKIFL